MKIVVIADDLTGAAEVAGSARRNGFSAEVQVGQLYPSDAEVLAIDADTRSQTEEVAYERVHSLVRQAIDGRVDFLYKKVDSILRGPVLTELAGMKEAAGIEQCLLVCGNPRKRRTVFNGRISINGQPLHMTHFASDPEHPRLTDSVVELLGGGSPAVTARECQTTVGTIVPGQSIDVDVAVGDVTCEADLDRYVQQWLRLQGSTFVAGGAEFFEAILRAVAPTAVGQRSCTSTIRVNGGITSEARALMVSGTSLSQCDGWQIVDCQPEVSMAQWLAELKVVLQSAKRVAVRATDLEGESHLSRVQSLTSVTIAILAECAIDQVWIEGGRTASNLIRELRIKRLETIREIYDGVVALTDCEKNGPLFFIKPGSYPWPPIDSLTSPISQASLLQETV